MNNFKEYYIFQIKHQNTIFIECTTNPNINRAISQLKYKNRKNKGVLQILSNKPEYQILDRCIFSCKKEVKKLLNYWKFKKKAVNYNPKKDDDNKSTIFDCIPCSTKYQYFSDYTKHISTKKHKKRIESYIQIFAQNNDLTDDEESVYEEYDNISDIRNIQQSVNELHNKLEEIKDKPVNNIVNNQTNFNVLNYLNNECNDAPNIYQFINQLPLTLDNCKSVADFGFLEPFKTTFVKALKDCEQNMRPIHCTDAKRNTCYIKNAENIWIKDSASHEELYNAINYFQDKHINIFRKHKDTVDNWFDEEENLDFFNQFITNINEMHRKRSGEGQKIFKKLVNVTLKENKLYKI